MPRKKLLIETEVDIRSRLRSLMLSETESFGSVVERAVKELEMKTLKNFVLEEDQNAD